MQEQEVNNKGVERGEEGRGNTEGKEGFVSHDAQLINRSVKRERERKRERHLYIIIIWTLKLK